MKEAGKTNYVIKKYPGLGHLVDIPFLPPATTTNHPLFPKPNRDQSYKTYFAET